MGRPNKGAGHVDRLEGAEGTKERLRVILRTMTGEMSVKEACDLLHVSPARLAELRTMALEGALDALDPKPPGRPAKEQMDTRAKELVALQNLVSELTIELEASRVRTELALTMPHVLKTQGNTGGKGGSPNVERWLKVVKDLANDERHDT
jgi:hypothetical protein